MATHPTETRRVHWKGSSNVNSDSSMLSSSALSKWKETQNGPASIEKKMGNLSLENVTFNGSAADKTPVTVKLPSQEFPTDMAAKMFNTLAQQLAKRGQEDANKLSEDWVRHAAMAMGESDIESVHSESFDLDVVDKEQVLHEQALKSSEEDFFDLSFEKDLQAKRDQFWGQVKLIRAIFEQAPITSNVASLGFICNEIQVHALEIASIFGEDVEKLRKSVVDLTSQQQEHADQIKDMRHHCDDLKNHLRRVTQTLIRQNRGLHEISTTNHALKQEVQAATVEKEQVVKRSQQMNESLSSIIQSLHIEAENMETAHRLEIARLEERNKTEREQSELRFHKDRLCANEILFSESEKVQKFKAELEAAEEDSTSRLHELKCQILYLKGCFKIEEKQHERDMRALMDTAEKEMEETCIKKDAQIKVLDDAMQDLTRLSTIERVNFKDNVRERDCWMKNQTVAWKSRVQNLEQELRESRLLHSNCQQKASSLYGLESKSEALEKENAALNSKVRELQASQAALVVSDQINLRERQYLQEQNGRLRAENTRIAKIFQGQGEDAHAESSTADVRP